MPAHQRKKITIGILLPFLVFVLFFSIMIWQKYRTSQEVPVAPPPQNAEGSRSVTLFFAAEGTRLAREAREIDSCEDDTACLESVLDELLNGPVGELEETVPAGTVVDAVRVEGKTATIEFNRAFSDAMPAGSSAEMLAVYAVVNTAAVNFPRIQTVKLNVDGNRAAMLRHLDLSDPLLPDYSLEQTPSPGHEERPDGSIIKHKKGEEP